MGDVWNALADDTRREILKLLHAQDRTAGEIAAHFDLTKPTISHHLSILKDADLITAEKHAQTITYSLNTTVVQDWMASLAGMLKKEDGK